MKKASSLLLIFCFLLVSGCALFRWRKAEIYPMSYDQTYEVAMSALDDMKGWTLLETDHNRGKFTVENRGYLKPTQRMTIIVKRIEPYRTKVELSGKRATPFNQKFFKAIDAYTEERSLVYPS